MSENAGILIGLGQSRVYLNPRYANRHGLIAGATGTGKTVTLQVLAEGFVSLGVPVFLADVKGDLSGISQPGVSSPKLDERIKRLGIDDFAFAGAPTVFWDVFGKQGHPVRATISEMGPLLIARLLELNDTQEGVLNVAFEFADKEGLLLLDLKDLRSTLQYLAEHAKEFSTRYGNVSAASVGAILRRLLQIEREGGEQFFGEPALDINDFLHTAPEGRGQVNLLAADKLVQNPNLYATFLLWLLAELFERLPEVGDLDKPRLVFFFDEAHLLFDNAPKVVRDKVEQVVRLIRSKGVGIYFITQSPLDIPEDVLGQLGNRIQHALRAFTPKDQKAVRAAAETFRANAKLDTARVITELGVGEALVSVLEDQGIPSVVQRTLIRPPASHIGPASDAERAAILRASPIGARYDQSLDRESAYERLTQRAAAEQSAAQPAERAAGRPSRALSNRQSVGEVFVKSVTRTLGTQLGRRIVRGVLGSILKGL